MSKFKIGDVVRSLTQNIPPYGSVGVIVATFRGQPPDAGFGGFYVRYFDWSWRERDSTKNYDSDYDGYTMFSAELELLDVEV